MKSETPVSLRRISEICRIDYSLVLEWAEFGLYPIMGEPNPSIDTQTAERLKRIISLHRALGLNKEGIEIVLGLRQRIADLELELETLRRAVDRQPRQGPNFDLLIEIDD